MPAVLEVVRGWKELLGEKGPGAGRLGSVMLQFSDLHVSDRLIDAVVFGHPLVHPLFQRLVLQLRGSSHVAMEVVPLWKKPLGGKEPAVCYNGGLSVPRLRCPIHPRLDYLSDVYVSGSLIDAVAVRYPPVRLLSER